MKRQIASFQRINLNFNALISGGQIYSKEPVNTLTATRIQFGLPKKPKSRKRKDDSEDDDDIVQSDDEAIDEEEDNEEEEEELDENSETSDESDFDIPDSDESDDDGKHKKSTATDKPTKHQSVRRSSRSSAQKKNVVFREPSTSNDVSDLDNDDDDSINLDVPERDKSQHRLTSAATTATGINTTSSQSSPSKKKKFVIVGRTSSDDGDSTSTVLQLLHFNPVTVAWPEEDDAICTVCGDGNSTDDNLIMFCEGNGCTVTVHQRCYGVNNVPEDEWLCDGCAAKLPVNAPRCVLCPVLGGAVKKVASLGRLKMPEKESAEGTQGGDRHARRSRASRNDSGSGGGVRVHYCGISEPYVHVACALWIPEVTWQNPEGMSNVDLSAITKARMGLKCHICGQAGGGVMYVAIYPTRCIFNTDQLFMYCVPTSVYFYIYAICSQCSYGSCCRPFHTLCGRFADPVHELTFTMDGEALAFCNVHSRPSFMKVRDGMQLGKKFEDIIAEDGSEDEDMDEAEPADLVEYELERLENVRKIEEARKAIFKV